MKIRFRNPKYWIILGIFQEWLFYFKYRNFGSKSLDIRILDVELNFYKQGKDVTHQFLKKYRKL